MKYLLPLFFLLSSCTNSPQIEPKFQRYVDSFVENAKKYGRPVSLDGFKIYSAPELQGSTIGQCYLFFKRIAINNKLWQYIDDDEREELVFHEMAHCLLYKFHNTELDSIGVPVSIMYPEILPSSVYLHRREAYLQELFQK